MTSASPTDYFPDLSLFTETNTSSNRISLEWRGSVYDQVNTERPGGQYGNATWPIQSYQLERCSFQLPTSLQHNSFRFYRDKIIHDRNSLFDGESKFRESKSPVDSSNSLRPESEEPVEKELSDHQAQKQSQISETLDWLSENYEKADGVCLPRCVLYSHYLDFCKKNSFTPAGAATFGKIIRQKFPKLTTRRLGTRGQSKYHYYGIGIKETSTYYQSVYSGKGLTRFSGVKIKTEGSSRKYSLSSKTGTLLPEFPNVENLCLPDSVNRCKLRTFTMMYRTHCQRILDTIISGNFEEVQNFLLHFWQGMPAHLDEILQCDVTNDIIALCDSILYKAIIDVLIPTTIQELPETLSQELKLFLKSLPVWLDNSLENMPQKLQDIKQKVVQGFIQSIRRQLSFVRLAQITRSVLQNSDSVQKMIRDALRIDFLETSCQTVYMSSLLSSQQQKDITNYYEEFLSLLQHQSSVESFTEWMDDILDRCVMQPSAENGRSFQKCSADFLLHWAAAASIITKDLTLQNSVSFGSFHLIKMMLDEYIFLVVETQYEAIREGYLQNNIKKLMKNTEEICMKTQTRSSSCRHQLTAKTRRPKYEYFAGNTGVYPSSKGQQHEENQFMSVDSVLTPREIPFSYLPNISLVANPSFYYSTGSQNDDVMVEDARPIQVTPLRYHNHQHHHHHHHHHHHRYPAISNTGYEMAQPHLPQYDKSPFSEFMTGNPQSTNSIVKTSDRFVEDISRVSRAADPLTDPANRALTKNVPYELRPNSFTSYNCFGNGPSLDACSLGTSYSNDSRHGALVQEAYKPTLKYYSRCLDLPKVSNPSQSNSYSASFMEIVQPDLERNHNAESTVQQNDIFKRNVPYSCTGW